MLIGDVLDSPPFMPSNGNNDDVSAEGQGTTRWLAWAETTPWRAARTTTS